MTSPNKKRKAPAISGEVANVGRAKKTKGGRTSAWNCFRSYKQEKDNDLMEELTEIEDDDAKGDLIMTGLVAFTEKSRNSYCN